MRCVVDDDAYAKLLFARNLLTSQNGHATNGTEPTLSLLSDRDYTLYVLSCIRLTNSMCCTGLRIQRGMTRRSLQINSIELHSCGTNDFCPRREFHIDWTHRYLTRLCDQIVCLLSPRHSRAIIWGDEDGDDESAHSDNDDSESQTRRYGYIFS